MGNSPVGFNLVSDRWLPAHDAIGIRRLYSLETLFQQAGALTDLDLQPHERVAVMRLLICITQATLGAPEEADGWDAFAAGFKAKITAYLDEHRAAFELFGDGPRFLQSRPEQTGEPVPRQQAHSPFGNGQQPDTLRPRRRHAPPDAARRPCLVTTAVFLSPGEIDQVVTAMVAGAEPGKALKKANRLDAADIAIFGRMIANDASLNVEGAGMFGHALSTHAAGNEIDFFSTVNDRKTDAATDAGADMIGTLEFTSALYYRYVGLNLDLLADKHHLGGLDAEDRRAVVDAFLRSAVLAVPGARRNTMNADTRPGYVLGLYHDKGQPLQLVNAFLRPIKGGGRHSDLLGESRDALKEHHENLKRIWGIAPTVETTLTEDGDTTFEQFATALTAHVS